MPSLNFVRSFFLASYRPKGGDPAMNFQSVRMHQPVASVTNDGDFAYVQVGCGHVTCKREGNRIVLITGPDCQLAASGGLDIVTVAVSSEKGKKLRANRT
jgi:hypothetical protein